MPPFLGVMLTLPFKVFSSLERPLASPIVVCVDPRIFGEKRHSHEGSTLSPTTATITVVNSGSSAIARWTSCLSTACAVCDGAGGGDDERKGCELLPPGGDRQIRREGQLKSAAANLSAFLIRLAQRLGVKDGQIVHRHDNNKRLALCQMRSAGTFCVWIPCVQNRT